MAGVNTSVPATSSSQHFAEERDGRQHLANGLKFLICNSEILISKHINIELEVYSTTGVLTSEILLLARPARHTFKMSKTPAGVRRPQPSCLLDINEYNVQLLVRSFNRFDFS